MKWQWDKLSGMALAFVLIVIATDYFTQSQWDGQVLLFLEDGRTPAAIKRAYDFSTLSGSAFEAASRQRLVKDARVKREGGSIGIELGHFVTKDGLGRKELACRVYDRVELVFHAEGMAVSGMPPAMIVEGECKVGEDINRVAPLWIPVDRLLREEEPGDLILKFHDDDAISLKFNNLGSEWPGKWVLRSVRLFSEDGRGDQVFISPENLWQMQAKEITIDWSPNKSSIQ